MTAARTTRVADVLRVTGKELRETLRDRRTLAVMILFPLVVYPLLTLLMAQTMAARQAAEEARTSRVAITAADPALVAAVRKQLSAPAEASEDDHAGRARDESGRDRPPESETETPGHAAPAESTSRIELLSRGSRADVAAGLLDALVEIAAQPGATPSGPVGAIPQHVVVVFDETREPSAKASERVETQLSRALPPGCVHLYSVAMHSLAPKSKVGAYALSKILPLLLVLMTMLGAFYPAIDITAGERERGTLETLLAAPVNRFDLMTGKVLAVATLAALTGIANIVSMALTVAQGAKLAAGAAGDPGLVIPWTRAAATVITVIPAALLFGAVMVAVGALARSFKEAQNLLTPVYLLSLMPTLVATLGDSSLAGATLFIPGVNLTLLARELLMGRAQLGAVLAVLVSTIALAGLALALAARLYDSERLLASTDSEVVSLRRWIGHLLGVSRRDELADEAGELAGSAAPPPPRPTNAPPTAGEALLLFALAFVLWYFAFPQLQAWRLIPGILLAQWLGFGGLVAGYARVTGRRLRDVLQWRTPRVRSVAGAVLVGLSGWVILGGVMERLAPAPRELVESMRRMIRPGGEERALWLSIAALAVTPAVCEEALFRGPILRGLRERFSATAACLLTGILFGILHGDVWRFVPTATLGVLLSWVALASGSIVPAMVVHVVNNGALVALGFYGWDKRLEALPTAAEVGIGLGAVTILAIGIALIRSGRRVSAPK